MIYKLIVIIIIINQFVLIIFIILELIKKAPIAANRIKQLIDGSNNNKVDKHKVLSDDKLINKLIKFLRGKEYVVII